MTIFLSENPYILVRETLLTFLALLGGFFYGVTTRLQFGRTFARQFCTAQLRKVCADVWYVAVLDGRHILLVADFVDRPAHLQVQLIDLCLSLQIHP